MIQLYLAGLLLFTAVNPVIAQDVKPAQEVVNQAVKQAAAENKKVFLLFHASWCGWCHKMDTSMQDPAVRELFERNFVITHLVVHESAKNKPLENPGAEAMKEAWHGKDQGIPFWVILDQSGQLITDSKIRKPGEGPESGENCGCPAAEEEVDFFLTVLRKTTDLTEAELEKIRIRFRKNEH